MLWLSSFSNLLRFMAVMLFVTACQSAFALDANKADIHLDSDLKNINIIVGSSSSAGGCPPGQYWDTGQGRCTTEVLLRTVNVSESCSCSCGSGTSGSCTSSRDGSYGVYGWTIPPSGQEKISYNGATNWGGCYSTSNSCVADPPPDSGGGGGTGGGSAPVGTTYRIITAMICDGSSPDYYTAPVDTPIAIRNQIISQYRSWEGQRCPETSGFVNWVKFVNDWAYTMWAPRPGVPDAETYLDAYLTKTFAAIDTGANQTGEKTAAGIYAANHLCQLAATERFGPTSQAEYVLYSGNQCIVTVE
ncbi:hypothetical protein M2401_006816 [Pseudomonas sp. JUb42]|uniref:hypothetical protein n=1 Tax=Pseudomonas sp. JUb42 TaxID=2940611 RepID=UPI002169DC53|nr:hypothetical protein [Pseudomonas sp. JUb42]MCS3473048.1 hypothetical protein [Pseudomonas sp. JUb42]